MARQYKYRPLEGKGDIRLIHLKPGIGEQGVSCSIQHVSEGYRPRYECLSYAWGDNTKTHTLKCDGLDFGVTANLHSALRSLRHVDLTRVLWVDAICINQEDVSERNIQVMMMQTIYFQAQKVLIWLGEEVQGDEVVFDLIREFEKDEPRRTRKLALDFQDPNITKTMMRQIGLYESGAMSRILARPWFSRVWILQEVIMAATAEVICGTEKASWDALSSMIRFFKANQLEYCFSTTPYVWIAIWMMASVRELRINGSKTFPSLRGLLEMTQLSQATDPRDRIFALLGISPDRDNVGVAVDYSLECSEVYRRFAKHQLLVRKDLTCLSFAGNRSQALTMTLPSWAPNWQLKPNPLCLSPLYNMGFKTSTEKEISLDISDDDILTISGFVVDVVQRIRAKEFTWSTSSGVVDSDEVLRREMVKIMQSLAECDDIAAVADPYPTGEDFSEAFWRTLICNRLGDGSVPGAEFSKAVLFYRYFFKHLNRLQSKQYNEEDVRIIASYHLIPSYGVAVDKWSSNRAFCVTEQRYLGWVPSNTQPGDLVCAFYGAEVPYVLRQGGDSKYQLLGDCYIHGIMEGQVMSKKDLLEQQFDIR